MTTQTDESENVLNNFRARVERSDGSILLTGAGLFIEHDEISLRTDDSCLFSGVSTDLPEHFTLSHLADALDAGEEEIIAVIEALSKMRNTSSRFDRPVYLEEALDHLGAFQRLLISQAVGEEA